MGKLFKHGQTEPPADADKAPDPVPEVADQAAVDKATAETNAAEAEAAADKAGAEAQEAYEEAAAKPLIDPATSEPYKEGEIPPGGSSRI